MCLLNSETTLLKMLQKTRGIALSYIRYRETSIIARVYTEEFGLQSYIVNSVANSPKQEQSHRPVSAADAAGYGRVLQKRPGLAPHFGSKNQLPVSEFTL